MTAQKRRRTLIKVVLAIGLKEALGCGFTLDIEPSLLPQAGAPKA